MVVGPSERQKSETGLLRQAVMPLSLFSFLFARNESKDKYSNVNATFEVKLVYVLLKKN